MRRSDRSKNNKLTADLSSLSMIIVEITFIIAVNWVSVKLTVYSNTNIWRSMQLLMFRSKMKFKKTRAK